MTSIARIDAAPASPRVDYAQEMEGARLLMKSGLLPQGIKSPEAALFIILTGRDLGLSPVQSLRSIHVIQGKIEVAADMQLGLYHRAGGRSQWLALTNDTARLKLAAPWLLEPHVETFTIADAKQAKLGGDNWAKYPKAMLRSRAITAGLKSIGFDPTAGIYAPGEIGGEAVVDADSEEVQPAPPMEEPVVVGDADEGPDPQDEIEREALAELEALIPTLSASQQSYAKEKLGDGADPVQLLAFLRAKAKPQPAGA